MRAFPTGTVTFLFTDVEGSTGLLRELGDGYAAVLGEHRRVLRDAFTRHGGVEVDTQGDALFVAFSRVTDALAAAGEGQAALASGPVRVRMGLHTGEPALTDEGYVGMDVHKGARIAAAGHGGQVLLSEQTARLAEAFELRALGEHRLKDLSQPERIFQLGSAEFPPLRSLHQTNLPVSANPLIGRKKELVVVLRLLARERVRLVTVVGPGGIGKTRFALAAAGEAVEAFPGGVWFVPLSPLRDRALVLPTAAAALGAGTALADHVGDRQLLLVLDNFEQVVDAAGDVAGLLAACPRLQLLVTSREPLRISAEREYPLPPLPEAPAIELFRQRAQAVMPDLDIGYEVAGAICARVDNLPLAIELAAARLKVFDPPTLLERLAQRLPLLAARTRDVPERQRTLRSTISWSYDLLAPDEQALFRRFGVFAGGATLEAVEAVAGADVDLVESLVDKSLLRRRNERFSMLETIREYALEQLESSDEGRITRDCHADHFLSLAERGRADLWGMSRQAEWHAWEAGERDNLRAALDHLLERDADRLLRLTNAMVPFWHHGARALEARGRLEAALARTGENGPDRLRLWALIALQSFDRRQGRYDDVERRGAAAIALAERLGDDEARAWAMETIAIAVSLRDPERAQALFDESGELMRRTGSLRGWRAGINSRANLLLIRRDYEAARRLLEDGLSHTDDVESTTTMRLNLAHAALMQERPDESAARYREALELARELGLSEVALNAVEGLAAGAEAELAAVLLGATDAAREHLGLVTAVPEIHVRELAVAAAQGRLGQAGFDAAEQRGRALSLDDAVRLALASIDSQP